MYQDFSFSFSSPRLLSAMTFPQPDIGPEGYVKTEPGRSSVFRQTKAGSGGVILLFIYQ